MEWPKLKNIILIILVLTNLCLVAFVAQRELRNDQLQRQAREEAILFLKNRGVSVEEKQVPREMELLPQTVERNLEEESQLAAALLGQGVKAEDRGAGVYRYSNDTGSIQFHSDGSFSAEFTPGAFPLGEDRAEGCRELLEKLQFEGELLSEQENALVFRQTWNGVPLFTQQVTLEVKDGCLVAMTSGRRLVGEPVEDTSRQPITVVTALIDFLNGLNALGDVCSRIDTITPGYVAATSLSGPMTLTPVWQITTDTGSYQLDTITGELSRIA
ncbi:hypothetical protein DWX58_02905 [Pseudoflavonifractor sp. AF19-9AC]|uniref:two-component system regulatory protein YycI n=1 Tax=Pseudoflavonifractor sp. AF19-9AC TaxID=2292244 RepID=UPI000E4F3969|nr:two-component system regulatory protein YycI [Pseudoflavonifractor sp. AF19-9AC]RHR10372.1 hypothetical protein DWX58_02905 [Pseudoflavonifractor sp. AF19-9AC]